MTTHICFNETSAGVVISLSLSVGKVGYHLSRLGRLVLVSHVWNFGRIFCEGEAVRCVRETDSIRTKLAVTGNKTYLAGLGRMMSGSSGEFK
jgi:hypothetical protein